MTQVAQPPTRLGVGAPNDARTKPTVTRARHRARRRLLGPTDRRVTAVIVAFAFLLVFVRHHGWYVNDNKFVAYWNPWRALRESFTPWVDDRDLGTFRTGYSPTSVAYLAGLRTVGLSAWAAQRVFHATLMAVGGIGVAALCRALGARRHPAPLVAGLWFVASPFTVGFLLPSWLYLNAVVSPWYVLAAYKGITGRSPWRWAAVFALCLFTVGSLNLPGLVYAVAPVGLLVAYLLVVSAASARAVWSWFVRAGLLAAVVFVPALTQALTGSAVLGRDLTVSESAAAVSRSSSWSESLRGLGGWLLYFNFGGETTVSYVQSLLRNPVVVLATFVPVVAAIAVVAGARSWKPRIFLGAVVLLSTTLMVGAFPVGGSSPFGELLLTLYDTVPATFAFRSTYKAGAGLTVAVAVLFGVAVGQLWFAWRASDRRRRFLAGGVAVIVASSSAHFWTGAVYGEGARTDRIPGYWEDATDWLESQPGHTRVLVLPTARSPAYTWGTPLPGDIFGTLLDRPFVMEEVFPGGTPEANNLVAALGAHLSRDPYSAGTLAPIARRLGIEYVVIRNDLDWPSLGIASPAGLDPLRADPDLELVATFGRPGENVALGDADGDGDGDGDGDRAADRERPPVEVHRLAGVADTARVVADGGSLVVSGDGEAWPELAEDGSLDGDAPVQYSGRLDDRALASALRAGAEVVVTDTNRRRSISIDPVRQPTIARTRPGTDLFARPGTQTVATYGDAADVLEVRPGRLTSQPAQHRPGAAFDGDVTSSWLTGWGVPFFVQGLEIRLREAQSISAVEVVGASGPAVGRTVSGADIVFPDGERVEVTLEDGRGQVSFPARRADRFRVEVTAVDGGGDGAFGLAEVAVRDLDLHEAIHLPTDVADAAARSEDVADALSGAALTYRISRASAGGEGALLRRQFVSPDPRRFRVSGSGVIAPSTPEEVVAELLGADIVASASDRAGGISSAGPFAVDGRLDTGWETDGANGARLALTFSERPLARVEVVLDGDAGAVGQVEVTFAGRTTTVDAPPPSACRPVESTCVNVVSVPVEGRGAGLDVRLAGLVSRPAPTARLLEVNLDGAANAVLAGSLDRGCRLDLASIDERPVPMTVSGDVDDLRTGAPLAMSSCELVELSAGSHTIDAVGAVGVDDLRLSSTGRRPASSSAAGLDVRERSATSLVADVEIERSSWLIAGVAFSPDWRASADGRSLGEAEALDLQAAWRLPPGAHSIAVHYGPQRTFAWAVWFSFAGVVLCTALAVLDPRRAGATVPAPATRIRSPITAVRLVNAGLVVFGYAVGGVTGGVLAVAVVLASARRLVTSFELAVASAALVAMSALTTIPPLGPSLVPVDPNWSLRRGVADAAARSAAILLAAALVDLVVALLLERGGPAARRRHRHARRRVWITR